MKPDHPVPLSFWQALPKTEVHLHIEAMASIDTLFALIERNQIFLHGIHSRDDLAKRFQVQNLTEFVDLFTNVIQVVFRNRADFALLLNDALQYLQRNSVFYAEIFWAPSRFLQSGLDFRELLGELESCSQKAATLGIEIRFLVDVSRSFGPENAMHNLELVLQNPSDCIIGIGLGGAENGNPARDYQSVFDQARSAGLHVVAHAGEDEGPWSIEDSLDKLQAERIGHGIAALQSRPLMERLRKEQIPLEICPTSNLLTGRFVTDISRHPVRYFFDYGLNVTLNSDDPLVFGSEISHEYAKVYTECGFSLPELLQIQRNGLWSTFMSDQKKEQHQTRCDQEIARLVESHQLSNQSK
ncbi:MAG: adenosine deaminase [Leptospiraceae bacterium]|nr:adenosine deaminase [Leptospiraceae bacterium]